MHGVKIDGAISLKRRREDRRRRLWGEKAADWVLEITAKSLPMEAKYLRGSRTKVLDKLNWGSKNALIARFRLLLLLPKRGCRLGWVKFFSTLKLRLSCIED